VLFFTVRMLPPSILISSD